MQLNELNDAVELITKKNDQYETERKKKENLHWKVSEMSNELEVLKNSLD